MEHSQRKEQGKYVFTTQGKSNLSIDPEVWEQLVFGKVVYKFKILSFLSRLIKTWYGFLFIVAIFNESAFNTATAGIIVCAFPPF